MTDPAAREWSEKSDSSFRLLCSSGWVLKARKESRYENIEEARSRLYMSVYLKNVLRIWHPKKTWFILEADRYYWLMNITPRMTTFNELKSLKRRLRWRIRTIFLVTRIRLTHRLWLDPFAKNFGFDEKEKSHYYLDDEVYFRCVFRYFFSGWSQKQVVLS